MFDSISSKQNGKALKFKQKGERNTNLLMKLSLEKSQKGISIFIVITFKRDNSESRILRLNPPTKLLPRFHNCFICLFVISSTSPISYIISGLFVRLF